MTQEEPMYREIPSHLATNGGDTRKAEDKARKAEYRQHKKNHPKPWYLS